MKRKNSLILASFIAYDFMRIFKILFVIFLISSEVAFSQTSQDVFTSKTIVYYGLDFSKTKFIGEFSDITPSNASELRDIYFVKWNNVIISESDKYNLKKFYKKDSVIVDLNPVAMINKEVDPDSLFVYEVPQKLKLAQIQNMVNRYQIKEQSGVGLVFIIESFDKTKETGRMCVTFFDIATRKILLSKRIEAMAQGFGLRNHWIKTVHTAMVDCSYNWKAWRKECLKSK